VQHPIRQPGDAREAAVIIQIAGDGGDARRAQFRLAFGGMGEGV
jgi:hypothetical protein